jgi:glycosyltransferase involved in cell wall biosynthesis
MSKVSVLIPSRNEQFLAPTIAGVFAKAAGDVEVIVHLDGYWPNPPLPDYERLHIIHRSKPVGMRPGLNACAAVATGDYLMKLDAHCMLAEDFDEVLKVDCADDWVAVPTRQRLDPERWQIRDDNRPPINYLRLDFSNGTMNVLEWREKNRDRSLDAVTLDDIISCQGSCYFMHRDYWEFLDLFDTERYGTFRKEPQEVFFKAWLSGGRCVRNKKTWYAHLHKGKTYGRGYSRSRADYDKGDAYLLNWLTDSAWEKQTIPFQWLLDKFSDMPGPQSYNEPIKREVVKLPNLYQALTIDGEPFSRPRSNRQNSRFWNEGRWNTFIAPLLPANVSDHTFVEMGANAGLYLKMAQDYGYRSVIGIEKDKTPVAEGQRWRDAVGGNWQLLKRKLGGEFGEAGTFSLDELPMADVTLMSCWHYYIDINAWLKYLDRLTAKTCYALIVSRPEMKRGHWLAQAGYVSVQGYFRGWEEIGRIENVSTEGDPAPRDLYAVMLKSPIVERVQIDTIGGGGPMREAVTDLAQRIASGESFDPFESAYAQAWRERKHGKWSERTVRKFVKLKVEVMRDVTDNGQRDPLIMHRDGTRLSDGGHRLAMLKALGYTSAIVRNSSA